MDDGEYVVVERKKDSRTSTAKKTGRNKEEIIENESDLLTEKACRSNDTFLTLGKPLKRSKTTKSLMESKNSTSSKTITILDNREDRPKEGGASMDTEVHVSPNLKKTSESPQNVSASHKTTRSKIPVRKRRGPKLTFNLPKSASRTRKISNNSGSKKARYRKTPVGRKVLRKADAVDADAKSVDGLEERGSSSEDLVEGKVFYCCCSHRSRLNVYIVVCLLCVNQSLLMPEIYQHLTIHQYINHITIYQHLIIHQPSRRSHIGLRCEIVWIYLVFCMLYAACKSVFTDCKDISTLDYINHLDMATTTTTKSWSPM